MLTSDRTDAQLLREFAQLQSDAAFRELTRRHVNLVFGTACRATNDHPAAEEITQNVFIALARKAAWLQREASLAAWLHRAALLEARQWWRAETRRRTREQTATELETTMKTTARTEAAMSAVLDEALLELREGERQAVLLRYFEGRNHREIGAALGIGEDAARKRVDKAMDQLLASFRQRGFAVGSAALLVTFLSGATQAAPTNLAAAASAAALASGSGATLPWLAKLLGLSRAKLAALCLATFLLPVVWQQARLVSARSEQDRMIALLAQLQSQQADLQRDLAQTQKQITRASTELADAQRGQTNSAALTALGVNDSDPRLFLWNEKLDYVRVPKSVLKRVRFAGAKDRWETGGGITDDGSKKVFDRRKGRISDAVLDVLGLDATQKQQAQELFSRHLNSYREWAAANSQSMDYPTLVATITNLPPGTKQNDATRVWLTPEIPGGDSTWQNQFKTDLATIIGDERTDFLLNMARNDGSLSQALRQFGAMGILLVVTPHLEGGFSLCRFSMVDGGSKGGNFNVPVPFSTALPSGEEAKFVEAAARDQIAARIAEGRAKFPDQEIPPMATLVEMARRNWELNHFDIIQETLGEPLPTAVTDYLRQWRSAHPEAPDAINPRSLPQHP